MAKNRACTLKHVVLHARRQVHQGQMVENRKPVDRSECQIGPVRSHAAASDHPCAVNGTAADQRLEDPVAWEDVRREASKNIRQFTSKHLRIWSMDNPSSVPSDLISRKKFWTSSTRMKCGTLWGSRSTKDLRHVKASKTPKSLRTDCTAVIPRAAACRSSSLRSDSRKPVSPFFLSNPSVESRKMRASASRPTPKSSSSAISAGSTLFSNSVLPVCEF